MRQALVQYPTQNDQTLQKTCTIASTAQIIQPAAQQVVLQFHKPKYIVQTRMQFLQTMIRQ
ncbi:hypothetical protein AA11825_1112 [Acetobacter pomorum DSM 11825]|nr:hypothetical protein AA11825_1112 [Acetobacter pomorum DSM 11825]